MANILKPGENSGKDGGIYQEKAHVVEELTIMRQFQITILPHLRLNEGTLGNKPIGHLTAPENK